MIVQAEVARGWAPNVPQTDVDTALAAAESYVTSRCRWPAVASDGTPIETPSSVVQATKLLMLRYLARRNSPDGLVGMGELGPARITRADADVEALLAPWRPVVFG